LGKFEELFLSKEVSVVAVRDQLIGV